MISVSDAIQRSGGAVRRAILPVAVLTGMFAGLPVAARTWTSSDGRSLEAELVSYDEEAGSVRIARQDGKEFTLGLDKLSEQDAAFLRQHAEAEKQALAAEKEKAGQVSKYASTGEHAIAFHVRYPKSYDGSRKLPMLILFSPGGDGLGILKDFVEAADKVGWTLVGCDRFKNGMSDELGAAMFDELLPEIEKTVSHDPESLYMGGFSGGAMRAFGYSATVDRPWKGIASCGGWLGGEKYFDLDYTRKMAVAIINGDKDEAANSWVTRDTGVLEGRRCKVKVFEFPGGHSVGPSATLTEAIVWMDSERGDRK